MSEMGKPIPGTAQDFEDTRKQRDPAQKHSPESNQQVTLGGAQSFVEGEVLKIDGQAFEIKKTEGGEPVRFSRESGHQSRLRRGSDCIRRKATRDDVRIHPTNRPPQPANANVNKDNAKMKQREVQVFG